LWQAVDMSILTIAKPETYEAERLIAAGSALGYPVTVTPYTDLVISVDSASRSIWYQGAPLDKQFRAVYLRYLYPYVSEGLLLAAWAAKHGLQVVDAALAEGHYVQSKMYNAWRLAQAGLPVPAGFQTMTTELARERLAKMAGPVIAKGVHGSRGKYVFKLDDPAQQLDELPADTVGLFTFQQFLEIDTEYRALVLDGQLLGVVSKTAAAFDFRRNASLGGRTEATELRPELTDLCERAATTLGYRLAGVDLAISAGRPYILEVNRAPGWQAFEAATGLDVAQAFIKSVAAHR
jgi:RimK family alpha-L-glutamate ligase